MSINNIDKKLNKKKKKKRNEIPFEEYAEKNNIKLGFISDDEDSPEELKKTDSNSNSQGSPKFESYYTNKSYSRLNNNLNLKKYSSTSTNNTSMDDEIKEKNKKEKEPQQDYNLTKNKFEKAFMQTKILNSIKNGVKEYKQNTNKTVSNNTNTINDKFFYYNNYNKNLYQNQNLLNLNNAQTIPGIKLYYTNVDQNNTNNFLDRAHMNLYIQNCQRINMNNTLTNCLNMNMKLSNYILITKQNLNFIVQRLADIDKKIEDCQKDIISFQKQTASSMILSNQRNNLINYMKKKANISEIENNNINICTNLKHPYYYTDHDEEIKVKSVLFLIEGLFLEEYITKDYILIKYLDRDGYASLTQLKDHPQLVEFKIDLEFLRKVFMEHRQNEVTETVETFDDILIRNKDWRNIKKKYNLDSQKIQANLLSDMSKIRLTKIQNLMGKKSEMAQIKDKLLFQRHINNQRLKEYQNNLNTNNNNIINMNNNLFNYITRNNIIYNNNIYNNNNNYNYNYNNYNNYTNNQNNFGY